MDKIELTGFEADIGTFELQSNRCVASIIPGNNESRFINIKKDSKEPIYYAFSGLEGLCRTTQYGSVIESNLLLTIASLDLRDDRAIIDFINNNGFLFSIPGNEAIIDESAFTQILYRLQSTISLINELSKGSTNTAELKDYVLYLLLSDKTSLIDKESEKELYRSPVTEAIKVIDESDIAVNTDIDAAEADEKGTYSIKDTIYTETFELDAELYDAIILGEDLWHERPEITDIRYRRLASVYKTRHDLNRNTRRIIDFLFHYMTDVGVVKNISLPFVADYYAIKNNGKLSKELKAALPLVAKTVVATEINTIMQRNVYPSFNPSTLDTGWKARNLLAALMFSFFHMRTGKTNFRRCANPSCNKYFSVTSTNGRKIYCCKKCRDARNSREHRAREKEKTPQD